MGLIQELKSQLKIVEKQRNDLSKENANLHRELKTYHQFFRNLKTIQNQTFN